MAKYEVTLNNGDIEEVEADDVMLQPGGQLLLINNNSVSQVRNQPKVKIIRMFSTGRWMDLKLLKEEGSSFLS